MQRRAEAVAAFVVGHERDLAGAGLMVDRRAGLIVAAAALRRDVARGAWDAACGDAGWIGRELDAPPEPGPRLSGAVAEASPLERQQRRIWNLRNTEGVTLGDAVAAARSGRPMDEGVDAPSS